MTSRLRLGIAAAILFDVAAWCIMGCSTGGGGSSSNDSAPVDLSVFEPAVDSVDTNKPIVRAVCIGWDRVSPAAYNGWSGELDDCELDAKAWAKVWRAEGIPTALLLTEKATIAKCRGALRSGLAGMTAGDMLIVCTSGHGGQRKDSSGEELDGKDEYMCAYDGAVTDDTIEEWLDLVPAGVRILWICDTCNSGTMHRGEPAVKFARRSIPRNFVGELLLLAGCDDGESSISTGAGGQWSLCLMDMGPGSYSPKKWFELANTLMTYSADNQIAVFTEYNASKEFRDGPVLKR